MTKPRILIVEDHPYALGFLKTALEQHDCVTLLASDREHALRTLTLTPIDLVLLDHKPSERSSGLELARLIKQHDPGLPVILITAYSTEALAIEAIREGINDYFPSPLAINDLLASIQRLVISRGLRKRPISAGMTDSVSDLRDGHRLVGETASMQAIKAYIRKVASTDSNTLIVGETGTGKELVAELIHKNSHRVDKPFICLNCAAIPDALAESELFGYERGAFTGAYAAYGGKLKQADSGTVFLDEIGDMSLPAQAKLLRALDNKTIQRLGGRRDVTLDVRIIAATNQNLEELASCGRFRKDLFFRLNVAQITLPPLRTRKADIPLLIGHFIDELNHQRDLQVEDMSREALDRMLQYDWPGNIRELKNVTEVSMLHLKSGAIELADIPEQYRHILTGGPINEKESILSALFATKWNKSKAAQKLHWSRMTLYRKLAKYHINSSGGEAGHGTPMISDSKL